jgi:hypothetical protein
MKKITLAILCFIICGMFVACGSKTDENAEHPDSTLTVSDELLPDAGEATQLENDQLPKEVLETIEYQYSGAEITNVVEINNGLEKEYKVSIKHRGTKRVLHITEGGKILIK